MGKSPRVIFKYKCIADGDWQIEAHYPGVEIRYIKGLNELKGSDGGLPDSKAPQCERTLYNVIGFQPPEESGGAVISPVGDEASRLSAIPTHPGSGAMSDMSPICAA
jgi:hypothetical protein